jgi:hypothetical protein
VCSTLLVEMESARFFCHARALRFDKENYSKRKIFMKRILILLTIGVIVLPAFAHAGGETKNELVKKEAKQGPVKRFIVPFELIKTQHMVVNIKVNGKGPYRLVFDTGAPDSLISNKVAKEANVFPKDFKKPLLAMFGSMGQMKIRELELGDLKADNISCMVLDHPTVAAIAKFVGPIEGILGFTFYARYKMSIDYEKKLITFEPNTYEPGDVMKAMMSRFTAPESVRNAPRILAPAGLLGIRVEKAKDDEEAGVTVKDVMADSPAAAAGFQKGDRLLTLNGRWTDSVTDCYLASGQLRLGDPAIAQVLRDGKKVKLKVTLRSGL